MNNLVNNKYGFVENVEYETEYKNIDYRDTTVPLWNTLYKKKQEYNVASCPIQKDINLALCASIIQLGKTVHMESNVLFTKIDNLEKKLTKIENKLNTNP